MEISRFLLERKTMDLRANFLHMVEEKHADIERDLNTLFGKGDSEFVERRETLGRVFQEVHRIKGAGGTYGFHEISFLYEDIIECIRPAHQEKRLPDPEEIEKAAADARLFREYLPVLLGAFKDLNSDDSPASTPALFYVTYARSNMFSHFHLFAIRSRLPIFSVINAGEARFALERIRPAYAVLDVKLPDGNGTALLQQILSKYPDVKGFILSAAHSESERRESISSGALDYWSVKTPAQYILKQVEKHVHKR